MTSRPFAILASMMFMICVAAYLGMRWWKFEHFRTSYVVQFGFATALAIALVRGDGFALWLTLVISACGAVSSFKLAMYPYPDGSTAYGLFIPGLGFSLCAVALLAAWREAIRSKCVNGPRLSGLEEVGE